MKNMCKSLNLICFSYRVFQQKVLRLIDNKTKAFCSISEILLFFIRETLTWISISYFFSVDLKLPELCELKDRNALNHETNGSLEFYILMHKSRCTFY